LEKQIQFIPQYKRFDFLINNEYILEIDGIQHFPNQLGQNAKIPTNRQDILNKDIEKMRSINYPIVRLFQKNIWDNKYDWKYLIGNMMIDLKPNTIYIRFEERDMYREHIKSFDTEYFNTPIDSELIKEKLGKE
jgi:hypothetical protein